MNLLNGIVVLDFSQYLAAPSAALRLADLGARVIKIERPQGGDSGRRLTLRDLMSDGDSVNFQAINRNKESFTANLKDPQDLRRVKKLILKADVIFENFRPGIMKKLGLDYDSVRQMNPGIVYGSVTGYGTTGPWVKKPGQDLLAQALSGITWLQGNADMPPTPFGLSLADSLAGVHLAQGVLACLFRRTKTGIGGHVEVSLLESILDFQFEPFSMYLSNGHNLPTRCLYNNALAYLGAPYGIYPTKDSFIAISLGSLDTLADLLAYPELHRYADHGSSYRCRDRIKQLLCKKFCTQTTAYWVKTLMEGGYWCAEVLNWDQLTASAAFQELDMILDIRRQEQADPLWTTRCPIRIDHEYQKQSLPAPRLGQDRQKLILEWNLDEERDGCG